jgi:dTDP-4-dehydrorhamnose 3,5-epimerase
MNVTSSDIPDVLVIDPKVFGDERGFFVETWSASRYEQAGVPANFVQDNLSRSARGVLRGLHLQHPRGQGKLVQVVEGEVFDVAVDVRLGSPTRGRWVGYTLSGTNKRQLYVPPGFAHGFCVVSPYALFAYKVTEVYRPEAEIGVRWNDPSIGVPWPIDTPTLSPKDAALPLLADIPESRLPTYPGVAG